MPAPSLTQVEVLNCELEVPLEDFEHLPRELGCSLHRRGELLTLGCETPGNEMHFEVDGESAFLTRIDIKQDVHGRFFRDVVGLMLQIYAGDLDAELVWSTKSPHDTHVEIRHGETSHPLLFQEPQEARIRSTITVCTGEHRGATQRRWRREKRGQFEFVSGGAVG